MNTAPSESDREPDERPMLIRAEMLSAEPTHGARIDFERNMRVLPWLSVGLVAACATVFALQIALGALRDQQAIVRAGALVRDRVVQGEVWRFLSAIFLHASPGHLIGNCIVLYVVGMACEHAFGIARTAAIYFLGGLGGGLLSVALHGGPSVGASGAIFAVMGATIVFFYRHHRAVHLRDKRVGFVLLAWALYQIGLGFFSPLIDNFAHVGGLLAGGAIALLLRPTLLPEASDPQ